MEKTIEQVFEELNQPIPRSAVSTREGSRGTQLSYLTSWYVIDRLNRVFGNSNWASDTKMLNCVFSGTVKDKYDKDKYCVSYIAQVRLVVQFPGGKVTEHICTGYGDGQDAANLGKAHELAAKEAESDALKRAAKNLGMSLGLALYDKSQENVEDDKPAPKPKKAASAKAKEAPAPAPAATPAKFSAEGKSRDEILDLISSTSRVVISKGLLSKDEILKTMNERYNSGDKTTLNDDQAKELLTYLQEKLYNVQ